ncbi:hypothetical protein RRG08_062648 [Elysia crispata]|uniref:Uncharacterized protein n=1 Tax=Elysia crispata TaxID=231223 RepID=A0AAE0YZG9_9GAST|nr:hypothetical protein RRG08_062648 [Elysia crispata]
MSSLSINTDKQTNEQLTLGCWGGGSRPETRAPDRVTHDQPPEASFIDVSITGGRTHSAAQMVRCERKVAKKSKACGEWKENDCLLTQCDLSQDLETATAGHVIAAVREAKMERAMMLDTGAWRWSLTKWPSCSTRTGKELKTSLGGFLYTQCEARPVLTLPRAHPCTTIILGLKLTQLEKEGLSAHSSLDYCRPCSGSPYNQIRPGHTPSHPSFITSFGLCALRPAFSVQLFRVSPWLIESVLTPSAQSVSSSSQAWTAPGR